MKKHVITEENYTYPMAYVANGVVGIRAGTNPFRGQTALLAGFTGCHERFGVEALAPVPAPQLDFSMDGSSLANYLDGYALHQQAYDFANGELATSFVFTNKRGQRLAGKHLVYASRTSPTLLIEELEFTPEQDCEITCSVLFDPTCLPIKIAGTTIPKEDCHGVLLLESRDSSARAGLTYRMDAPEEAFEINYDWGYEVDRLQKRYGIKAKAGQRCCFKVMVSYVPGLLHSEPHWQAVRMIKLAVWKGYERLREENRKAWAKLWESRVEIKGEDSVWQDVVDASFFYLYSTIHPSSPQSMAPFGLSQRDLYKGHVFWDTESFMYTLPLLTDPASARAVLDYRFDRLAQARSNAKINGYNGIQFPWQSGATGDEVTRVSAGAGGGAGEQHVNMDVAMAFIAYWKMTGDMVYLREKVWPVVYGVSEWIESRAEKTARGYEILYVTGIDEGTDNVDNDSFTNTICKQVLTETNKIAVLLGYPENKLWAEIAEGLFLPIHPEKNYMMQYEGCPIEPSMTCESLMAFFPYFYSHSKEVDENTYRFYIEHDLKAYLSYPMMSAFLGVIPAWIGDRKLAKEFFDYGSLPFFKDPFMMCTEYSTAANHMQKSPDAGEVIFLTGRGSLLTGLMLGLTHMNIYKDDPEEWFEGPIVLPEGFDALILNKVYIRGRPAKITARHGAERAELTWL